MRGMCRADIVRKLSLFKDPKNKRGSGKLLILLFHKDFFLWGVVFFYDSMFFFK